MRQFLYRSILFLALLSPFAISISCNHIEGTVEFQFQPPVDRPETEKPDKQERKPDHAQPKHIDSVLICESSTAYAYHKSYCSGLSRCKATVAKIPKSQAEDMGRRACKMCY